MKKSTKFLLVVLLVVVLATTFVVNIVPSNYLISVDLGSFTKWSGDESFGEQPTYAFCFYKEGVYNLVVLNVYDNVGRLYFSLNPEYWDCPIG